MGPAASAVGIAALMATPRAAKQMMPNARTSSSWGTASGRGSAPTRGFARRNVGGGGPDGGGVDGAPSAHPVRGADEVEVDLFEARLDELRAWLGAGLAGELRRRSTRPDAAVLQDGDAVGEVL